jgi:hypothetical protein
MADFKQSREANQTNFVCRRGGSQLYRVLERKPDGVIVQDENGKPRFLNEGSFYNVYFDEPKPIGDLTVKVDIDASDAITALKAIQREARSAVKALRELEAKTAELQRDGVVLTKEQAELLTRTAEMHKGEVVIPREQAEKFASTKPPTNITINIPEITVKDDADIEKIARELAEKLSESKLD